jgi:hypothetical protein
VVLAEKIRRCRSVSARTPDAPVKVGFVVESDRRARTVHEPGAAGFGGPSSVGFVTGVAARVLADSMGARWTDGQTTMSTRKLAEPASVEAPILTPGCLSNGDGLSALDDRGSTMLPTLRSHVR